MTQAIKTPILIDVRGPRFSASLTVIVLAAALATQNVWILFLQFAVFAIGAFKGPQFTPYAWIFKRFVKPRLKGDSITEDVRPPQFAQKVGLGFSVVGLIAISAGSISIFTIAVGFALAAAFLNAAFNYCLGCEMYLLALRLRTKN